MNRSSRAHLAPVPASCWNAASPSLFCLLPLKSTDSNGRSWRPAWKNCSAFTLSSARYGERLNADLNVMSFWNAPVKGVLFTVSCQTSLHSTSCFIPSLAYPWHLLYNVLPVLRHSTIWPKSMPGIPVPASEFCPLDCKSTSLAKFRYWTDAPGSTWALVSTVWSSHTPKDHTVWLWNRLYSYASSFQYTSCRTPQHQAYRIPLAFTARTMVITEVISDSWMILYLNQCLHVCTSTCMCVCPEIYAIIHREEKRSSQDSAKFHVGSLERDLQPGTSQLPGRSDTNTTNWISITESIFCHSCTSKIAVAWHLSETQRRKKQTINTTPK